MCIFAYVLISGGGLFIYHRICAHIWWWTIYIKHRLYAHIWWWTIFIAYMLISGGLYIHNSSLMCSYLADYIYKSLHIWWIIYIIHRLCAHIWWWTIYKIHRIYAHIWWTLRIDRLQQAQSICQRCEWKEEKP